MRRTKGRRRTPEERIAARVRARWRRSDRLARQHAKERGAAVLEDVAREAIIRRDGLACHLCGEDMTIGEITFDHVVPLSKGGAHTADNVRLAHRSCNSRKGARV